MPYHWMIHRRLTQAPPRGVMRRWGGALTLVVATLVLSGTVWGSEGGGVVSAPASTSLMPTASPSSGPSPVTTTLSAGAASPAPLAVPSSSLAGSGETTRSVLPPPTAASPAEITTQAPVQQGGDPSTALTSEPSSIERTMTQLGSESDKATTMKVAIAAPRQFGYSFFAQGDPFAAMTDIPVGPDYVIGAGDRIVITAWGGLEGVFETEVSRNGEITLPKVGALQVAGVPFGQLPKLLQNHIGKVFKDFQINVTMGKLRLMKVFVVGEVRRPGAYSVSSLSTLINVLSAAGGPTGNGTLRNIEVKRNGKLVETVDLYDFFLKGDKSRDIRLQSGDTVFVPAIGKVAGIAGNVRRPAIYELKGEKTLADLVSLADGIIPTGYLQRIQISRIEAHEKKTVVDVNIDPKEGKGVEQTLSSILLQDMDLVKIFPIDQTLRGYVRLEGYVLRPGDYALKPGMRLSDLLASDNLLPEYHREIGQIVRLVPPDFHPELIIFKPAKAAERLPGYDLELHEFDTIRLFSRWEMEQMPKVIISGDVQKPGSYRLFDNMRVRDLVYSAGNVTLTAYLKQAELTRIERSWERVSTSSLVIDLEKALAGDPQHNVTLRPMDELFIRRIPYWVEETNRYITLTGEVLFPGTYPVYRGERLSSVIARAGGFTDKAYLRGAKYTRESTRKVQQKQLEESLIRLEMEVAQKQAELAAVAVSKEELDATKASLEGLQRNIEKLKGMKAEGRVVIALDHPERLKGGPGDIEVEGGDTLHVPANPRTVSVLGSVYNPSNFIVSEDRPARHYLELAGGSTASADEGEIYILRADGTVESRKQSSWFASLFGFDALGRPLQPGDAVVVPQKIEKTAWLLDIKDITTILSQLAITAGTVILGLR